MPDDKIINYIKDHFIPCIQSVYKKIEPFYTNLAIDINRYAINQRNWRMYIVDLGGNGRHRNIRKAIRLMDNNKSILANIINTKSKIAIDCRIKEKLKSPLHDWIMRTHMSDKGL